MNLQTQIREMIDDSLTTTGTEKNETFENRIIYSLPVRLGLWNETLAIEEHKYSITSYKKEHGELLLDKTRRMMKDIIRSVDLAYDNSFVKYGEHYQIKTRYPYLKEDGAKCTENFNELFLSGLITENEIDYCQSFKHGCILVASSISKACIRNTFKIIDCDGNKTEGEQVRCGEDVYIQIVNTTDSPPLYVRCPNVSMDSVGTGRRIYLSQVPDFYCRFKMFHWDPSKRMMTNGTPFAPNACVIIQHSASGQNLAAEISQRILTFFGPESLVDCRTYKDSHKVETSENLWMFVCHSDKQREINVSNGAN